MRLLAVVSVMTFGCKGSLATPEPPMKARSGTTLDDTPAQKQFTAWLTAFNAGNRAGLVAYHDQQFPYAVASEDVGDVEHESDLAKGTGGFEIKKVEATAPTHVTVTMKEQHSLQFARAEMDVAAAAPHHVTKFVIHPIPTPWELLPADQRPPPLDAARKQAIVDGIARELDSHYVTPAVGTRMIAAMREHLVHGDYQAIARGEDFAAALTKDLRAVSHDLHLAIDFEPPTPPEPAGAPAFDERAFAKRVGYGFGAIERMANNVARIEIQGFPPIVDDEARAAVAERMSQVADADALILDLRINHGGDPETVALVVSYVFDAKPVHINDMYSRDTGKTEPSFTVGAELKGKRFGSKKPVFVLTSKGTFSGGEELAYDLQALHRATIVGETTGGGAHPVEGHRIDDWFSVRVPSGKPINPVTKTDWEGTGVLPDVPVAADKALEEAHRRAVAALSKK